MCVAIVDGPDTTRVSSPKSNVYDAIVPSGSAEPDASKEHASASQEPERTAVGTVFALTTLVATAVAPRSSVTVTVTG